MAIVVTNKSVGSLAIISGALCSCGCEIVVAPPLLQADAGHTGDFIVSCVDFAHRSFWFSRLVAGKQPENRGYSSVG